MKWYLLPCLIAIAPLTVAAQGKVSFGNDSNHYFVVQIPWGFGDYQYLYPGPDEQPYGGVRSSPFPSGAVLYAALFAGTGTSGNNLTMQVSYPLTNVLTIGRMVTGGIVLNGVPGGTIATMSVVVSDTDYPVGSTYPGDPTLPYYMLPSWYSGHYYGTSRLFTMTPGTSLTYPSITGGGGSTWAPAYLVINPAPEPGSFALLAMGLGTFAVLRRSGGARIPSIAKH